MLYQLPNGKVIYLTIEEFLSLGDTEFNEITSGGYGEEPSHAMYYGKQKKEKKVSKPEDSIEEFPLDYIPDNEDTDLRDPIDMNNLPE